MTESQTRNRLFARIAAGLVVVATTLFPLNARPDARLPEATYPQTSQMNSRAGASGTGTQGANANSRARERRNKRGLFRSWFEMAKKTEATEPDWLSPLATTSGRLKNELRYDVWEQPSGSGYTNLQLGGNKGLEFITSSRTQLLIGVPTYTFNTSNGHREGFGDIPLQLKVRIASSERQKKNYLLTFILAATAPTGSHLYGSGAAVLTPTLAAGKGWRGFDVQSTFGVNLPGRETAKLGRQAQWNTAFQYAAAWKIWPELELNSTFYRTGKDAGDNQVFITPGAGFGRVRLGPYLRFSSAVGMQTAATRFHTYNHRWMYSLRLSF